jgi:phage-related protein
MPQTIIRYFRDGKGAVPSRAWMEDLEKKEPKSYARCLAAILELSDRGFRMQRPRAAPLDDGIYELRWHIGSVQYRIAFFWYNSQVVLSHGFTKEGEVPPNEIDRAKRNRSLVQANPKKHLGPLG